MPGDQLKYRDEDQVQPSASWKALSDQESRLRKSEHTRRLAPFLERFRRSRERGVKHPVYDFLFSYYSFSMGQLLRWSPGFGVLLAVDRSTFSPGDAPPFEVEWPDHFVKRNLSARSGIPGGTYLFIDLSQFPERRLKFLNWAITYLEKTLDRPPVFHCFGLHEWAMVYKAETRHHNQTPLRVSSDVLSQVIETNILCCTHYDAFRFFTPAAGTLNRCQLTRESVMDTDQAGCVHANMDLYKFGYKIAPYLPSELLADLFLLARRAREIDMSASPYDLSEFGVEPIPIETKQGREQYLAEQRSLHEEAQPLRRKLLEFYRSFRREVMRHQRCS